MNVTFGMGRPRGLSIDSQRILDSLPKYNPVDGAPYPPEATWINLNSQRRDPNRRQFPLGDSRDYTLQEIALDATHPRHFQAQQDPTALMIQSQQQAAQQQGIPVTDFFSRTSVPSVSSAPSSSGGLTSSSAAFEDDTTSNQSVEDYGDYGPIRPLSPDSERILGNLPVTDANGNPFDFNTIRNLFNTRRLLSTYRQSPPTDPTPYTKDQLLYRLLSHPKHFLSARATLGISAPIRRALPSVGRTLPSVSTDTSQVSSSAPSYDKGFKKRLAKIHDSTLKGRLAKIFHLTLKQRLARLNNSLGRHWLDHRGFLHQPRPDREINTHDFRRRTASVKNSPASSLTDLSDTLKPLFVDELSREQLMSLTDTNENPKPPSADISETEQDDIQEALIRSTQDQRMSRRDQKRPAKE
jgi:hypothetical protein